MWRNNAPVLPSHLSTGTCNFACILFHLLLSLLVLPLPLPLSPPPQMRSRNTSAQRRNRRKSQLLAYRLLKAEFICLKLPGDAVAWLGLCLRLVAISGSPYTLALSSKPLNPQPKPPNPKHLNLQCLRPPPSELWRRSPPRRFYA